MIPYSKAFPHAEASGRLCPFPQHFLITLDEVRTLLRKKGWSPRTATAPPRTATKEEIASPTVRTYQLITQTEATPRDFLGIGCRFLLGRTYCFGEVVEEREGENEADRLTTDKEATTLKALPWGKTPTQIITEPKRIPTHHVTLQLLTAPGKISSTTHEFTCKADAEEYAARAMRTLDSFEWMDPEDSIKSTGFNWLDTSALAPANSPPARVLVRPV
jgi:hypothetical protein